jgi:hypothetical protein
VRAAQRRFGDDVEVLAALGLGRSYGARSRVLLRGLPGILQSGLWRQLESLPPSPTRALVTDVGNDILYGSSPEQILEWVEESVARLQQRGAEVVITDLPLASVRRLSRGRFLLFRSILFPPCRLTREQALDRAERVVDGLERLAERRKLRLFRLRPEWYGLDPVHFRPGTWGGAWQEILEGEAAGEPAGRGSPLDALRLYLMRPEREWLAGRERTSPQTGVRIARGARVWLY